MANNDQTSSLNAAKAGTAPPRTGVVRPKGRLTGSPASAAPKASPAPVADAKKATPKAEAKATPKATPKATAKAASNVSAKPSTKAAPAKAAGAKTSKRK